MPSALCPQCGAHQWEPYSLGTSQMWRCGNCGFEPTFAQMQAIESGARYSRTDRSLGCVAKGFALAFVGFIVYGFISCEMDRHHDNAVFEAEMAVLEANPQISESSLEIYRADPYKRDGMVRNLCGRDFLQGSPYQERYLQPCLNLERLTGETYIK